MPRPPDARPRRPKPPTLSPRRLTQRSRFGDSPTGHRAGAATSPPLPTPQTPGTRSPLPLVPPAALRCVVAESPAAQQRRSTRPRRPRTPSSAPQPRRTAHGGSLGSPAHRVSGSEDSDFNCFLRLKCKFDLSVYVVWYL